MMRVAVLFVFCMGLTLTAPAQPIKWLSDYDQALQVASTSGKPILIYCVQESCGWCVKMDQQVFANSAFAGFAEKFIPVRIGIDDEPGKITMRQRFDVTTVPTLLVIDSTGKLLNRISGYVEPSTLIADIEMIQEFIRLEKTNPNDSRTIQKLAEEYLARDMNAEAESRFRSLLQRPISDTSKESAHFSLAMAQYYQQKNIEAIKTLQAYIKTYPDGRSIEDAMLLLAQIHLDMDGREDAKRLLADFLKRYPDSKNAPRAREVLNQL